MNLYHLRYFVTLAKVGNYSLAAKILSITQPSLTLAIKSLEEELGIVLFEKIGRHNELTEYGRIFLSSVEISLSVLDSGIDSIKAVRDGFDLIRIGHLRTLGLDFIPSLIRPYDNRGLSFSFFSGTTDQLVTMLEKRQVDLIFSSLPKKEGIHSMRIKEEDFVLIVPIDHPLAMYDEISLFETSGYEYVYFSKESGLHDAIDGIFKALNLRVKVKYKILEDEVISAFVAHGFGIAVVPLTEGLGNFNVKIIRIKDEIPKREIYCSYLEGYYKSPPFHAFLSSIKELGNL